MLGYLKLLYKKFYVGYFFLFGAYVFGPKSLVLRCYFDIGFIFIVLKLVGFETCFMLY
jgi:hypothetical protein